MKFNFSIIPEGDHGQVFSKKIDVDKNSWNTLKSTQFFMLIANMLLVGDASHMYLCQILVKKIENCVSIIVCWGLFQVASLGKAYYLISFSRSICPLSTLKKIINRYFVFVKKLSKKTLQISIFTSFWPCCRNEKIWRTLQSITYVINIEDLIHL
jgi:hypothetical protein